VSDSQQTETITEEFVIQGLLKEVLRSESVFAIDDSKIQFKIVDLLESKIRDSSDHKKILVRTLNGESVPEVSFSARGGFYRSLVQFETVLLEKAGPNLFWLQIPKILTLFNYRKDERSPVKPSLRKACPLLMVTNGIHCEGTFTIEDTSLEGVGGLLQVPTGFPCSQNTEVRGKLYLDQGELEIKGTLIRVNPIAEVKFGYDAYSVGIKQAAPDPRPGNSDTRTHERYPIRHEVTLMPLIHPDHSFKVDLLDISIGGFSGRLIAGSVLPAFPIGTVFEFPNKATKIVLANFSNDIYRFQIVSRSESEAIEWLRTMTPVLHEGAQCSIKDARDLYKIFLQAGAISTQYLKRHELYEDSLVKEHSNIEDESGYLHRWYVRGKDKAVEAHISAIRVSNNCWFVGDLAKVRESRVDGEALVKTFFKSFAGFANEMQPSPKIMGMWVAEHPLWKSWDLKLKENPEDVVSCVRLSYFRLSNILKQAKTESFIKEINSKNFSIIRHIQNQINNDSILDFLSTALDFDPNNFGSANLKPVIPGFTRRYFEFDLGGKKFISVFTVYASGKSINRVMDSIYLAQFEGSPLNANEESALVRDINFHSSLLGVTGSSVRFISDYELPNPISGQEMKCYILTPSGFGSFEGFT
jgi:hypothetical protein